MNFSKDQFGRIIVNNMNQQKTSNTNFYDKLNENQTEQTVPKQEHQEEPVQNLPVMQPIQQQNKYNKTNDYIDFLKHLVDIGIAKKEIITTENNKKLRITVELDLEPNISDRYNQMPMLPPKPSMMPGFNNPARMYMPEPPQEIVVVEVTENPMLGFDPYRQMQKQQIINNLLTHFLRY